MARRSKKTIETTDYRHGGAKRTNIPPAKIAGEGKVPSIGKQKYAYSPHLSPVLRFDSEARADKVHEVVEKACSGKGLTAEEQEILRAVGASWEHPSLEWAGKKEEHDRYWRTVDPVALHIHERVSANAILSAAKRKDVERTLFADPELEYREAVQFYKYEMDWANRLILGDSQEVMASLARREDLGSKVQMIYMDPPYGIKFASNFQPEVGSRDVKEKESDLTREPEMVRAYRDTWSLGIHSYLSYLRDRLELARDLLEETGSIFVQISDENIHRVRAILDEVFGPSNFVSLITVKKTGGMGEQLIDNVADFILWYAKDKTRAKFRRLYGPKETSGGSGARYSRLVLETGEIRPATQEEMTGTAEPPKGARYMLGGPLTSQTASDSTVFGFDFEGRSILIRRGGWKTNRAGMERLIRSERILGTREFVNYRMYLSDFPATAIGSLWTDTMGTAEQDKRYVVQTTTKVVQRCMLMTTDPGDLVLDPTCGSGTTAYVAEQWGRRWVTIDTSRVALSVARQRLLTARFDRYLIRGETPEVAQSDLPARDPSVGFVLKTVPHITLASIARNENLDPVLGKHEPVLDAHLARLNEALAEVPESLYQTLAEKLAAKAQRDGLRAVTNADVRCWLLPGTTRDHIGAAFAGKKKLKASHVRAYAALVPPDGVFEHWHVPFNTDPDWPASLSAATLEYRQAWRAKMDDVDTCISANADQEMLVDQPEVVAGVVRVTGPFTVEGVMPEELNIGDEGLFDGTPKESLDHAEIGNSRGVEMQNLHAYLSSMIGHLRSDGVTFPDNKNPKFARLESLFDSDSASALHAEGVWEGDDANGPARVGVGFGPQYGPVTARQVEELIREASRRGYDELVVAGFSFDAEAHAIIHEDPNPKVRMHVAQIRPDLNAGMDGLLKDTPSSELFTVFGSPAIDVTRHDDEYTVTLQGVDIYDPVKNTVRSTGATKVAAWFLDSNYDGRTFCITQAFFPDQDAWGKLAKSLKDVIEPETFAVFKGTTSLPFEAGEHKQVAVKVIDPRGSEVMTIHKLEG